MDKIEYCYGAMEILNKHKPVNCNGQWPLFLPFSSFVKGSVYSCYPLPVPPLFVGCVGRWLVTLASQVYRWGGVMLQELDLMNYIPEKPQPHLSLTRRWNSGLWNDAVKEICRELERGWCILPFACGRGMNHQGPENSLSDGPQWVPAS